VRCIHCPTARARAPEQKTWCSLLLTLRRLDRFGGHHFTVGRNGIVDR
jgi:hypothetical protein